MGRRAKLGILIAMLVLSVGFAAITTTLVVNGTLSVGPDGEGFDSDIIFTKAKTTGSAYISSDGKSITFNADLMDIGQEQDLAYEITNKSRQYNAKGSIECGFVDEDNKYNNYITVTPVPENFDIEASRKVTGHVTLRMIQSFIGDDDGNDFANIEFKCTIKLDAGERDNLAPETPEPYKDDILNGADPVLTGGLIPVSITNDGKVIYADMYDKWYDYDTKRWANAVLLNDEYQGKYEENDVIPEDAIQSYFVWIPRYRYQLWNVDQADGVNDAKGEMQSHTVDIVFETKSVEPSTGTQNGEWLTHPAFTNFDVNGLWVGKFETGTNGASTVTSDDLIIKPNVTSYSGVRTLKKTFELAYNYKRNSDSHMIMNTEWGAVTYLTYSEYGANSKIRINNNSAFITGYAAVDEPTCQGKSSCAKYGTNEEVTQPYNTTIGYLASTTGNITGIYDMSGGSHEMTASYSGPGRTGTNTTFINTNSKYIDMYPESKAYDYSNRILGDATGELGPFYKTGAASYYSYANNWNGSISFFLKNSDFWTVLYRGGDYNFGSYADILTFISYDGGTTMRTSFRIVLTV